MRIIFAPHGHSYIQTTINVYTHLMYGDDTRAIESLKQPRNVTKKNKLKKVAAGQIQSERQDLNLRPHGPQPCALPN